MHVRYKGYHKNGLHYKSFKVITETSLNYIVADSGNEYLVPKTKYKVVPQWKDVELYVTAPDPKKNSITVLRRTGQLVATIVCEKGYRASLSSDKDLDSIYFEHEEK